MASTPPDQESDQIAAAAAAAVALDDDLTLVDGESEQELHSDSLPNPDDIPSSSKQLKKEEPEAERKENKHGTHDNLKSTLLFSGIVIAVVGALFAVIKKIKEA